MRERDGGVLLLSWGGVLFLAGNRRGEREKREEEWNVVRSILFCLSSDFTK